MLEILLLILIIIISLAVGNRVLRIFKLSFDSFLERFLFAEGLGLGIIAYSLLLLGALGLLYRWLVYGIFLAAILIFLSEIKAFLTDIYKALHSLSLDTIERMSLTNKVIAGIFAMHLAILFIGVLTPPFYYDPLYYHLAIPKLYILNHKVFHYPWFTPASFPFTIEMLYCLSLLLIKSGVLAQFINFFFLILILFSLYSFSKKHVNDYAAYLSPAIFLMMDVICWSSRLANVDLGLTFYSFLGLYALFNWFRDKGSWWLILSGINCGLSMGIKYTGIFLFVLMCILILIHSFIQGEDKKLEHKLKESILFGLVAILVCSPWYLKNLIITGNPIYPLAENISGAIDQAALGENLLGENLLDYLLVPWYMVTKSAWFRYSIGPLSLSFMPLLIFHKTIARNIKYLLLVIILYFVAWESFAVWKCKIFMSTRYLMPVITLLSIITAYSIGKMRDYGGFFKLFIPLILILTFIINLRITAWNQFDAIKYVLGVKTKDQFLSTKLNFYETYKFINKNLPHNVKIMTYLEDRFFYLDRDVVPMPPLAGVIHFNNYHELLDRLTKHEVTHILVNKSLQQWWDKYGLPNDRWNAIMQVIRGHCNLIYSKNDVYLYELLLSSPHENKGEISKSSQR